MQLTMEQIQRLSPNGSPLHLTVSKQENQAIIRTNRDFEFTTPSHYGENDAALVRRSFQHYPDPVTINGEPTQTNPFPDLARVRLTTYDDGSERHTSPTAITLSREHQSYPHSDNAYVAGIICRLHHYDRNAGSKYLTPLPGPHKNWQQVATVEIDPIWQVNKEELSLLQPNKQTNLPEPPPDSAISQTINERAHRQNQRTLQHPRMYPPANQERIFNFVLGNGNIENNYHDDPMPILVNGTPITLPKSQDFFSTSIAVAEAMYQADCQFVPVSMSYSERQNQTHEKMEAYTFEIEDTGSRAIVAPADRITLCFQIQDDPKEIEHRVDAPIYMEEDYYDSKKVRYVPEKLTTDQLSNYLCRGYLNETNCRSWDEVKEEARLLENKTDLLAESLLENPINAFRKELNEYANAFSSDLMPVEVPLTETSRNGRVTVNYHPKDAASSEPTVESIPTH